MSTYLIAFLVLWFLAVLVLASLFGANDGDAIITGGVFSAIVIGVVAIFA